MPASGQGGIVWVRTPEELGQAVLGLMDTIKADLLHELSTVATQIETWMQDNHKWQNITGQAEAGLRCEVFETEGGISIIAYHDESGHTDPHGYWLEVAHGGVWGIIRLGLESHYGVIMGAVKAAIS